MLRVPDARFIVAFDRASEADSARMGGKCAGLARMIAAGVNVPNGFAITTDAYAEHLESGRLRSRIETLMRSIDIGNVDDEERKIIRDPPADHVGRDARRRRGGDPQGLSRHRGG